MRSTLLLGCSVFFKMTVYQNRRLEWAEKQDSQQLESQKMKFALNKTNLLCMLKDRKDFGMLHIIT